MDVMTEKDLRGAQPCDLGYFDQLTEAQRHTYLTLNTVYRRLLNAYVAFMGVGKYDIALAQAEEPVQPAEPDQQDLYQRFVGCDLRYYYVRNNVYVERLTPDELAFLRERVREKNLRLDYDSLYFVEDTYRRVIREREGFGDLFDDDVPEGALLIGYRVAPGQGREAVEQLVECNAMLRDTLERRFSEPALLVP